MNLEKTLMLGVPLDGKKFAAAYLAAMIEGHTEVVDMIDNQLLKRAANDAVKVHLTERAAVSRSTSRPRSSFRLAPRVEG